VFKPVKHHEIPQRSHTSKQELRNSVEQGFDSYAEKKPVNLARVLASTPCATK